MTNKHGKSLDKTYLSCDNAKERGFLHRDYIAHCLRWTHIVKFLTEKNRYKDVRILDIGCGKEAPLIKTLYSSRLLPYFYCGVDAGNIQPSIDFERFPNIYFFPNTNIMSMNTGAQNYEVIIMFEVLEHNEKEAGIELLKHVQKFMGPDTTFFMSTPCFNGSAAANHVYEWRYEELAEELIGLGFNIINQWGTFASIKDYGPALYQYNLEDIFAKFREYYDSNYLATIFAPLFPRYARNVLWKLSLT